MHAREFKKTKESLVLTFLGCPPTALYSGTGKSQRDSKGNRMLNTGSKSGPFVARWDFYGRTEIQKKTWLNRNVAHTKCIYNLSATLKSLENCRLVRE